MRTEEDEAAAEARASDLMEHEERLEELVVKLDLVGAALSEVHLPAKPLGGDEEALELEMVAKMEAPVLRTVLWSLLDRATQSQCEERTLSDSLRRREAEANVSETKIAKLEALNAELRRNFHERVSTITSERIEFAQAICSPVGKKQDHQLGALHALNADLEVTHLCSATYHLNLAKALGSPAHAFTCAAARRSLTPRRRAAKLSLQSLHRRGLRPRPSRSAFTWPRWPESRLLLETWYIARLPS